MKRRKRRVKESERAGGGQEGGKSPTFEDCECSLLLFLLFSLARLIFG